MKTERYQINRYLDEQRRLLGLALDECIPMIGLFVVCFFMKAMIIGLMLMALWLVLMRALKRGRGSAALFITWYWHMAGSAQLFRGLPNSTQRVWS